jgi:hypothetical protein
VARPEGFEPPTLCSGGTRSIHLSYGRIPNRLELAIVLRFVPADYAAWRPPEFRRLLDLHAVLSGPTREVLHLLG